MSIAEVGISDIFGPIHSFQKQKEIFGFVFFFKSPLYRISAHYLLPTRFVVVGSRRLSRSNVGGGLGTRFHFILKLTRTKLAEVT